MLLQPNKWHSNQHNGTDTQQVCQVFALLVSDIGFSDFQLITY